MASGSLNKDVVLNDRYRIERVLGRGGMGTVYLAEHIRLDTVVAVKEVTGPRNSEEEYRVALQQCEQEAKFLVRLNHPNLPRVMDAFIEGDRFYLVMEYIEGVTLEACQREAGGGPLEVTSVVEWGLQVADVLAYLHSQEPPIIFRDLKPANIMLQPGGSIRLIDFGIARRFQPGASKDTALLGSVGYSPPEQFGKHQTDTRSDLYAFGATLHHLLTGRDPAGEPFKFPSARSLNPQIPEMLSRLLEECVAMDPAARPAGIHEVAMRLLAVRDELAARPPSSALTPPEPSVMPVVTPSSSTVPAAPTGPRIISTKLAEAEALRRRESREMRAPSGSTDMSANDGGRSKALLVAALLVLLIIIGGGTVAIMRTLTRPAKQNSRGDTTNTPSRPKVNATQETVVPPSATAPPTETVTEPSPPRAVNRIAEITSAKVEGIALDEQKRRYLAVRVNGAIQGQANKAGMISLFFFDSNDRALPAVDSRSVYANRDGQLSVAYSLDIKADEHPFDVALTVPLDQFPPEALATGIKYRCVTFVDQKRVAETELLSVPYDLNQTNGMSASDSNALAPQKQSVNSPKSGGGVQLSGGST